MLVLPMAACRQSKREAQDASDRESRHHDRPGQTNEQIAISGLRRPGWQFAARTVAFRPRSIVQL
ncbi:hypothetical protein DF220_00225 [Salinibacterium hongtaonis]|uniref:Uncharacterized protein n=1 Tax=Homoserinimonas hongtaonis TaxID=2079791 RepID=A0A2U1SY24_9MICO|nr:hypothetical protein DF220_00225 [Salinibacterium hongtaonis]